MRKVAVLGYYGYGNFGDELILEGIKQLFKGWEVIPLAATAASKVGLFDFDLVNSCDLFVLGGGELIHSDRLHFYSPLVRHGWVPPFIHRLLLNSSWIRSVKVPKVVLGCGVNAESAGQLNPRVVADLAEFDYIGLRDETSVKILQGFPELADKTRLFYDLAFSVDVSGFKWEPNDLAVVFPTDRCLLSDRGVREVDFAGVSRGWLRLQLAGFRRVMFVPFGCVDNDDYLTCVSLLDCCHNGSVMEYARVSLDSVLGLLEACSYVVSYRLHGLVLAFMLGLPYKFFAYHWKVKRVHDTLKGCSVEGIKQFQKKEVQRF